jgi:hypothetical protein
MANEVQKMTSNCPDNEGNASGVMAANTRIGFRFGSNMFQAQALFKPRHFPSATPNSIHGRPDVVSLHGNVAHSRFI